MMTRNTTRRTLLATSMLAVLAHKAQMATAFETSTPTAIAMPASPAGAQLEWILDVVNGDGPLPAVSDIEARFSPEFLTAAPASDLIATLVQLRSQFAPVEIMLILESPSPNELSVVATTAAGMDLQVSISVQPAEPHLIEGLWFAPYAGATKLSNWNELDAALTTENGVYGVYAARLEGAVLEPIHVTSQDVPLAVGSAFKLYVLGALVQEIEAATIAWSDEIEVVEELLSLPSGVTQDEALGTKISVEELALRMISISDNTATDLLIHAVGRDKVETALETLGNSVPELNRPFLTTREMFIIKLGDEAKRTAFVNADESRRREQLADIADSPLPDLSGAEEWTTPRNIDSIEWFATMEDLSNALVWLRSAWQRPGLEPLKTVLTSNPGVPIDAEVFPVVAFKGGSELGVLTLAWLLERQDGEVVTLSVTVNDPTTGVDEVAVAAAAAGAIGLLAE